MKTVIWLLILAFAIFAGYAWYAYYSKQPADRSKAARMWGSLVAAAGALLAVLVSWFSAPPTLLP